MTCAFKLISNFGRVIKRNCNISSKGLLQSLLRPTFNLQNLPLPLKWGRENEERACEAYQIYLAETGKPDVSVHRAGLFIDLANGWLAASPDRLVSDPLSEDSQGLCEIKCPYSARNLTPENACRIVPNFCCRLDADGSVILRKGHSYYYQIQGQMAITGRNWCDFVVYTPYGISVERITFNESFWLNEMLPKLDLFYDGHYLPFYMEFFNP